MAALLLSVNACIAVQAAKSSAPCHSLHSHVSSCRSQWRSHALLQLLGAAVSKRRTLLHLAVEARDARLVAQLLEKVSMAVGRAVPHDRAAWLALYQRQAEGSACVPVAKEGLCASTRGPEMARRAVWLGNGTGLAGIVCWWHVKRAACWLSLM